MAQFAVGIMVGVLIGIFIVALLRSNGPVDDREP